MNECKPLITGNSTEDFTDLPAQLQVPFTLGPGDVTVEFTSDGRGLHSFTVLLKLSRFFSLKPSHVNESKPLPWT